MEGHWAHSLRMIGSEMLNSAFGSSIRLILRKASSIGSPSCADVSFEWKSNMCIGVVLPAWRDIPPIRNRLFETLQQDCVFGTDGQVTRNVISIPPIENKAFRSHHRNAYTSVS